MPLPELGRGMQNQAPQRRLSRKKISLENISNASDATNTLARRVKNMRIRLVKKHTQISITKLRDRKHVVSQSIYRSDIIQGEAVIYLDDASLNHLTLLVIPKSHILLM
jgi:anionic cell wall polymer biosynthesis LytR-Cps2A-Psr (LCP) family protein